MSDEFDKDLEEEEEREREVDEDTILRSGSGLDDALLDGEVEEVPEEAEIDPLTDEPESLDRMAEDEDEEDPFDDREPDEMEW